jgi:hypothetical protein
MSNDTLAKRSWEGAAGLYQGTAGLYQGTAGLYQGTALAVPKKLLSSTGFSP